ncbi:hypothetical protein QCA50_012533 [Cerrena zonata]|uniref:FBD domain-containing protein n=1 Tax=Cerrena zonata TaxID=2478898 RepID=A0AAW0FXS5_9APHY
MPRLQKCNISRLDLTIAHPSLYRFPSSTPLLHLLCLDYYTTEKANQLCRFLTSFRSLSILTITQSLPTIHPIRGHFPHLQFNRSKCALRTLALVLEGKPNLSTLLESFIKAPPFVSHLRHLIVAYSSELTPSPSFEVRDITELLEHCSQSLEEVTVIVGHIRMVPCTNLSSCSHFLDPKVLEKDRKRFTDEVGCLDDIFSRERFRSFHKFRIRAKVEPFELPKLKERKVNVDFGDNEDPIPW